MRDLAAPFRAVLAGLRRLRGHGRRSRSFSAVRSAHHRQRVTEIQADLSRAAPGFIFITGDSNAELLGEPRLGGPVVNGGIGATLASEVAGLLHKLKFEARASVAVVLVGQNETLTANGPMSRIKKARFTSALSRIERLLKTNADVIVFSAIPPPHRLSAGGRDPLALDYCSKSLRAFCAGHQCVFADLFEDVRSCDAAFMRDDTPMDQSGAHLADYGPVARRIRSTIETIAGDDAIGRTERPASPRTAARQRGLAAVRLEPTTKTDL